MILGWFEGLKLEMSKWWRNLKQTNRQTDRISTCRLDPSGRRGRVKIMNVPKVCRHCERRPAGGDYLLGQGLPRGLLHLKVLSRRSDAEIYWSILVWLAENFTETGTDTVDNVAVGWVSAREISAFQMLHNRLKYMRISIHIHIIIHMYRWQII